ncbi:MULTISPECIES: hypothetical protein [unclassified Mycobacterium]|uniref:hypothetical protein n=1 Tax=unclassified Mycobacterium TaxID=2642494 RepID=UPI0029C9471E|nr:MULTISPECIES: hypothetical protein [unclassified Mycobacterium]
MAKPDKRKRPPVSVAEAEQILERARRREAAQAAERGAGTYAYREMFAPQVDLGTLDTPGISHADQWADFLNRPGRFYVAQIVIPLDGEPLGQKLGSQTTLKADDDQLPYLVEVLRQVRGAFGEHARITLTPAEPHVEERRIAGPPARVTVDGVPHIGQQVGKVERAQASMRGVGKAHSDARDRLMAAQRDAEAQRKQARVWCCGTPITGPHAAGCAYEPTPDNPIDYNGPGFMLPPPNGKATIPNGPPISMDEFELGPRRRGPETVGEDGLTDSERAGQVPPWAGGPIPDREFTRDELAEMLPGQTRTEVAAELGKTPDEIGGVVHHADVMPEALAAELGVPVESLRRIPMTGGGYAWTVTPPPAAEEPGRHAAPEGS